MIDKSGFSYAMTVNPTSTFKPLPDWVAFDLCSAYQVPGGNYLLHNTRNGKRAMVKPEVHTSLLHCSEFKTIAQHATALIEAIPGLQGQQSNIQQVLQQMLDSGMMVSAKGVCDTLKSEVEINSRETENTAPVAAIITWDRPQALERLLESIASNCDTRKLHRLYVIDDSRKDENLNKNRLLVKQFASRIETSLQYFGQDEQKNLLEKLTGRLPQHENAIYFLADQSRWLNHWSAGRSRNLALLLSCGHRLVMLDDDSVCDVYEPPQPEPNITFSDDPREADFFGSEQEWAYLHQPINPDPINRHMQCLGLSFSEAMTALGTNHLKPAGLGNATAQLVSELHPDSRVLMTECGSLGCPGTTSNTWLPYMTPNSLKRVLSSPKKTTHALEERQVWSGRNHPHFAPRPNMSQITGFDNRQMLPPYLPNIRAEDRLFGYMLDFIFPSSVTLDYPWAIPHLPIPKREWQSQHLSFKPADSFPAFFYEKVLENKSSCLSDSPNDRLANLSAWFIDMATASNQSLTDMYRDARLHDSSGRLAHLHSLLATSESAPVNWKNYLRNGISQLNADLEKTSHSDFPIKGVPAGMEGDELIAYWKDVWSGFATALKAWPEIRSAATEILMAESQPR